MQENSFVISLPRKCVGKSSSWATVYDFSHESLEWATPDPRISPMSLMSSSAILDPLYKLRRQFPGLMWTADSLLVPSDDPEDVFKHYEAFAHCEMPLDMQHVSQLPGELRPRLKAQVEEILSGIVSYAKVAITVTTSFVLHMYGSKSALSYAQYKLFVVLNHLYGYSICKLELPLSKQPLVAGPDRHNLLTLFQQTGINVYMPPPISASEDVSVDEVYLAGEEVQLILAETLLKEIVVRKTDVLEKECVLSTFVRDSLVVHCQDELDQIMLKHATFIQLSPPGSTNSLVRIVGTTRRSIENSIESIMKLCGSIYCVEIKAHLDPNLTAQVASVGVSLMNAPGGTVIFGVNKRIRQAMKALKNASTEGVTISVLLEQPLELMDFILGKKQGKVLKVVHGTGTTITVEKFHEQNFRLRLSGDSAGSVLDALTLLEDELPAEKSLYIPEVYHKQVIGQGGLSIQTLMRKYNVYMRFANTTKEKYPNAFGDTRSDNVIIRCPAKNSSKIDAASNELLDYVSQLSQNHVCRYVRLTRNHRRMLLESHSNGLREAEVASGAAIKLPEDETKDTQLVEISGQTLASTETAIKLLTQLLHQTDYEFRIPWSTRFLEAVGPRSKFGVQVSAPLFLAMSAQVQTFEKVQLIGDANIYSQVVVSVQENFEGELFDDISQVITSYLRHYNIDIIDKGRLNTELQVEEGLPVLSMAAASSATSSAAADYAADRRSGSSSSSSRASSANDMLYHSPQQHEAQVSLDFLRSKSETAQLNATAPALTSHNLGRAENNQILVPRETPIGLPSRPPMSTVQWNRNFDETPVKKRGHDSEQGSTAEQYRLRLSTPRVRLARYRHRRL